MSEIKKVKNLKEFSTSADRFEGANLLCPGCAHSIIVREVLNATNNDLILSASTGCLEVCSAVYPQPSGDAPWIHSGAGDGSTAPAGADAIDKALRKQGRLQQRAPEPAVVSFAGAGATYAIGTQWISAGTQFEVKFSKN